MANINPLPVLVNGVNYSWAHVTLILFGKPTIGVAKISYKEKQAKENNYGLGGKPISRGYGNYEYEGSIELYTDVWKSIISASPNRNPLDIPPFEVKVMFGGDRVNFTTDILKMCEFLENPFEASQGDSKLMVTIPLIIGDIQR